MDRRFGHPGSQGILTDAHMAGPSALIRLLLRQAVMIDRRTSRLAFVDMAQDCIDALRSANSVPRSLRRSSPPVTFNSQCSIVTLLMQLNKLTGNRWTAKQIHEMIAERVTLYADYWEFAVWDYHATNGNTCNLAVVANALGMTENEAYAHVRAIALQRAAERTTRAAEVALREAAWNDAQAEVLARAAEQRLTTSVLATTAQRTKEFAGT